jgi:hypothetical protein
MVDVSCQLDSRYVSVMVVVRRETIVLRASVEAQIGGRAWEKRDWGHDMKRTGRGWESRGQLQNDTGGEIESESQRV